MPRTLVEAPISSKQARAKLPRGIHKRGIDPNTALVYRKGPRGGSWIVRWRSGAGYDQKKFATADDALPANGDDVLNFEQALARAAKVAHAEVAKNKLNADGPPILVSDAVGAYVEQRELREQSGPSHGRKRDARSRLTKHVLSAKIAAVRLDALDEDHLSDWRSGLPVSLKASTKTRLNNDFKAALNAAYARHRKRLPAEFPNIVKNGLKGNGEHTAPCPRQHLTDHDVDAILTATLKVDADDNWDGDLYRLVMLMAHTGARFSQIVRMKVGDVQQTRVMIPVSSKGKAAKATPLVAVRVDKSLIDILASATAGRSTDEFLLMRWKKKQIAPTEWVRDRREPWAHSTELRRPWTKILKTSTLPSNTKAYALRDASIVRRLLAGAPTRTVAAMHDTSVRMIEKHYSSYILEASDDVAEMGLFRPSDTSAADSARPPEE